MYKIILNIIKKVLDWLDNLDLSNPKGPPCNMNYINKDLKKDKMDKIYKKGNSLVIEVPLKTKRFNLYEEMATGNGNVGEMAAILGVIAGDEIGFAHWIDMDYKNKEDQISTLFYEYCGEERDFEKLCKKLDLVCYKYPLCDKCGKVIYGCYTSSKDYDKLCNNCANTFNKNK